MPEIFDMRLKLVLKADFTDFSYAKKTQMWYGEFN